MSFSYGRKLRVTLFGSSHGPGVGVVLDGVPAGTLVDWEAVQNQMRRRSSVGKPYATGRKEPDRFDILSGWTEKGTDGGPLTLFIPNESVQSEDYDSLKTTPRPMHADYPAMVKYGTSYDPRGGSFFSGRMTAPLVLAGSIAIQLLEQQGIYIGAHIARIGEVQDMRFPPVTLDEHLLLDIKNRDFPVLDLEKGEEMLHEIQKAKEEGDSLGGTIECGMVNLPVGMGSPWFCGLESTISSLVFAIPGVKGIEFGSGFEGSKMRGSKHNDGYVMEKGKVRTKTNHHGGILGGLSTGMPMIFHVACKPTASIAMPQETVDLNAGEDCTVTVKGRHDPCIVPRAVVCVEAATAIAMADQLMVEGVL